jgi:hypothetical protein
MKGLICPVSSLRIGETTARTTGFMMAAMIALYAYTGVIYFVMAMAADYSIRAFTNLKQSPFGWLAAQVVRIFEWPEVNIEQAPKTIAARVGFLFALAGVVLYYPTNKQFGRKPASYEFRVARVDSQPMCRLLGLRAFCAPVFQR